MADNIIREKKIPPKQVKVGMKRRRIIIGTVLAAIIFSFILFSDHGLIKRIELEIDRNDLSNKITEKQVEQDSLARQIDKLQSDFYEIEKIAREYYGMIKPGEKIYIIHKEPK